MVPCWPVHLAAEAGVDLRMPVTQSVSHGVRIVNLWHDGAQTLAGRASPLVICGDEVMEAATLTALLVADVEFAHLAMHAMWNMW